MDNDSDYYKTEGEWIGESTGEGTKILCMDTGIRRLFGEGKETGEEEKEDQVKSE